MIEGPKLVDDPHNVEAVVFKEILSELDPICFRVSLFIGFEWLWPYGARDDK